MDAFRPPRPPSPVRAGGVLSTHWNKPQGCRGACGIPQGTGAGSATPGWVTTASEVGHAEHENGAYHGDAVEVPRSPCQPAPTQPLWAASPGCGTFSKAAFPSHPGDEHKKV
ncbi:hypothetical protein GWK47_039023 [Chionoecetes opilio]|uniref:Uncharacterized protein n=1 Tax=Chionoecetes opilio TaxID=41210 RepID=A0A8J5CXY9_CHIOP|nr:hypothetical protein GWK47_039023 [Chionoecetes opilio]